MEKYNLERYVFLQTYSFASLTVQEGVLEEELGDHDFLLQDMGSVCLLICLGFWGTHYAMSLQPGSAYSLHTPPQTRVILPLKAPKLGIDVFLQVKFPSSIIHQTV